MWMMLVSRVSDPTGWPIPWKGGSISRMYIDVITVAGKCPSAKGWQGLTKVGRAEEPQAKKLASAAPELGLSGQAADSKEDFGGEEHPRCGNTPGLCLKSTPRLHLGSGASQK